jgi:hypothetical protein
MKTVYGYWSLVAAEVREGYATVEAKLEGGNVVLNGIGTAGNSLTASKETMVGLADVIYAAAGQTTNAESDSPSTSDGLSSELAAADFNEETGEIVVFDTKGEAVAHFMPNNTTHSRV